MPPTGCTRQYDYSLRDQSFFLDTWSKLNVFDSPGDSADEKEREQVESYFDTGLNIDRALSSSKRSLTEMSGPNTDSKKPGKRVSPMSSGASSARATELPRFGFVEKLQLAFGIPDLLSDNPFLNKDAASKMFKCQKKQKRVRFAKVEISEKHQPNCRRGNFEKEEFGHLHSPSCSNYKAEQTLCKQEFLIRGNFIRENAKKATSENEFYFAPVRPLEPLDPRLVTPASLPPHGMHLDLKSSALDSITYHDKISPGLRCPATPAAETEKEPCPPPRSSLTESFAPNPDYKPMPCQPIFSNDIIISSPPSGGDVVVDNEKGSLPTGNTTRSNLQEPPIPEISVIPAGPDSQGVCDVVEVDALKLLPDGPDKKERSGSDSSSSVDSGPCSIDSGYDSKCGDFLDDFLNNLSDDESETEDTDETSSESTTFAGNSVGSTNPSESETETLTSPITPTSPCVTECSSSSSDSDIEEVEADKLMIQVRHHDRDSGIGSLSDNEEDIDDLIKSRSSVRSARPAPTKPHTWSCGAPSSAEPAATPVKHEKPDFLPEDTCFLIRDGYVNPFSQKRADSPVGMKHAPSVLGRLICDAGSRNSDLVRNPDLAPDRFMFDSPSPDDVVRLRQQEVYSC